MENYQMIADENELKWFFEHCVVKPQVHESYSAVFVCRHKKLAKEEMENLGISRKESEFISVQTFRNKSLSVNPTQEEIDNQVWDCNDFLKKIRRFNVDKGAYLTGLGYPIPEKSLVIIFYINPCNDIKVATKVKEEIDNTLVSISEGLLNGKTFPELANKYRWFTKLDSSIKHYKANCKGSKYWIDFDIDVPKWWKEDCYQITHNLFELKYGKGNFIIVDTSGGYHVLVRTKVINSDPHLICKEIDSIYKDFVANGKEPYLDDNGNCKFECILNDSQIPGIPLPGTYQYGRAVTILNKDDLDEKK